MISTNISTLRKRFNMTQEEVAEKINVSRQALAKWERGESIPDVNNCVALATLFQVSLDELVNGADEKEGLGIGPKGKHFFGSVTVGERGQIVIPKKARDVFAIQPGDQVLMFGDEERGIAMIPQRALTDLLGLVTGKIFAGKEDKKEKRKK